jgi:peptidoglycan/LPS O-acetylase OafA/YrhL
MVNVYAAWPFALCMIGIFIAASTPAFKHAADSTGAGRVVGIDGLRGYLALSVYFYHATIYRRYLTDGAWTLTPSAFYTQIGPDGVAMFFIITGYLFWARLLARDGRVNMTTLLTGRVFRIAPLYLFATALVVLIAFLHSGFHLLVPAATLAHELLTWAALGSIIALPDINGMPATLLVVAGVYWSLHYEWLFYASLILTRLIARLGGWHLPIVFACWVGVIYNQALPAFSGFAPWLLLFLSGMLTASLARRGWLPVLPRAAGSALIILSLALQFNADGWDAPTVRLLLMSLDFALIVSGATLFGLLAQPASQRLGAISYGIYLLQGLVLYAVFQTPPLRRFALGTPAHYWLVLFAAALILITVASITHLAIEQPGIALGRRVIAMFKRGFAVRRPA